MTCVDSLLRGASLYRNKSSLEKGRVGRHKRSRPWLRRFHDHRRGLTKIKTRLGITRPETYHGRMNNPEQDASTSETEPKSEPKPTATLTVAQQLLDCEEVDRDRRFAGRLAAVLEFTQLLFDDDENLTRVGNLSGVAKTKLEERVLEIFDMASESSEPEQDSDEDESEDNEAQDEGDE